MGYEVRRPKDQADLEKYVAVNPQNYQLKNKTCLTNANLPNLN